MSDYAKARYEFKKKLEELRAYSGRATELISLYVPPNRQISDVMAYLRNELSQSSNIKSKSTRKNVTAAIESIMARLRYFKSPPTNGVVFFVGHVPKGADQTEMVAHVIEPPEPITTYLYRCNSSFYLEPLEEMLAERRCYGLIVIDRNEATIGLLKGKRIKVVKHIRSNVMGKHRRGGQSAARFERLIEQSVHEYFKKVGTLANEAFLGEKELVGLLIGGPGSTKNTFVEKDYLHYELKKKIVDIVDTGYTDEYGLKEVVEHSVEALAEEELMKEKKLMNRLMREIRKEKGGLFAYGEKDVIKALKMGAVEVLLVSEGLNKLRREVRCANCGHSEVRGDKGILSATCPRCGAEMTPVKKDIVEELYEMAESVGTRLELISEASEEGQMLLKAFGGIAALLRFRV